MECFLVKILMSNIGRKWIKLKVSAKTIYYQKHKKPIDFCIKSVYH